ncbi:hypothetical protein Q763_17640 [Flavobacterium beibuense F44-8]|uniref:Uncharacterized protein n=1 Tax=Flavobacterium beibuense F44-8 TaxID=1406840 RepID=A0A0A2LFG0_9FLAO|nr:hypothetical protein [Flavobacterium beibuense]KGO78609.1 hypothetical protein Q763_17640 [Flavobacterium beibuense F44-8]
MHNFKMDLLYHKANFDLRPKVSYKLKEYIEDFFVKALFTEKKIIVNSKFSTLLQVSFFIDKKEEYIVCLPCTVYKDMNIKAFPIMVSYIDKFHESKNVNLDFANMLFDVVSEFLLSNYKKIKFEDLKSLREEIDKDYLSKIIYPAPFNEQCFIGDDNMNDKKKYLD